MWHRAIAATLLVGLTCAGAGAETGSRTLRIQGSRVVGTSLGPSVVASYTERYPDTSLQWDSAGSGSAFVALFEGVADLGISTRSVAAHEVALARKLGLELKELVLGLDGIAVIVHPDNPVESLSSEQLRALFAGDVTRWMGVGGSDEKVRLLSPPPVSGIYHAVRRLFFQDEDVAFASEVELVEPGSELVRAVQSDASAVGLVSMSLDRSTVKTLPIAVETGAPATAPTAESVRRGAYPLRNVLKLYLLGEPSEELHRLLGLLLLQDGVRLLEAAGFVPLRSFPALRRGCLHASDKAEVSVVRLPFGFGGSRLRGAVARELRALARRVLESGEELWIRGHADSTESSTDPALSESRARAASEFLEEMGVPRSRMIVEGRDAAEPIASNLTPQGRRQNRRADVWILPKH